MLGFHLINISFTLCSDEPDNKQFVKMSRKSCLNKPHSIKKKTELEDHVDIGSCSDVAETPLHILFKVLPFRRFRAHFASSATVTLETNLAYNTKATDAMTSAPSFSTED